jgi:hypothetical protein
MARSLQQSSSFPLVLLPQLLLGIILIFKGLGEIKDFCLFKKRLFVIQKHQYWWMPATTKNV